MELFDTTYHGPVGDPATHPPSLDEIIHMDAVTYEMMREEIEGGWKGSHFKAGDEITVSAPRDPADQVRAVVQVLQAIFPDARLLVEVPEPVWKQLTDRQAWPLYGKNTKNVEFTVGWWRNNWHFHVMGT